MRRIVCAAIIALALAGSARALEYALPQKFILKNGLRLIVKTDHSIPRVGLALVVQAGPGDELESEVGASRLVAGLWTDAGEDPANAELTRRLEGLGAYWGARTEGLIVVGMAEFPSDAADDGLALASRWLSLRKAPDAAIEKVRDAMVREVGYRKDNPRTQGAVRDQLIARVYHEAPAARALLKGTTSYAQLGGAALESFAGRLLVPNRATLTVVGDVDSSKILEAVQRAFPQGAAPQVNARESAPATPSTTGERAPETSFGAVDTAVAALGFRAPLPRDPDYPAIMLLARHLAGGAGSVLERRLVESEMQAKEVNGSLSFQPVANLLWFEIVSTTDDAEPAGKAVLEECARLARHPPEGPTLEALRTGAKAFRALNRQKLVEQAVAFGVAEIADDVDLETDFNARLDAVTPADLKRAAAKWLAPSAAFFTQMRPASAQGKIEECLCARDLPDGVSFNLRRDTSSEVVGLALYLPGGFYMEPPGQAGISNLLEELLAQGSTSVEPRDRTVERLGRQGAVVSRLKLLLSSPVGKDGIVLSLNATLYSFDELLKTLRDIMFEPSFDQVSFRAAKDKQVDAWRDMVDNPEDNGGWEILNRIYPGVYARPAAEVLESVKKITIDDLKAFHAKVLGGKRAVIGVSGNLTEQRVTERVNQVFAGSAALGSTTGATPPPPAFAPLAATRVDELPGKKSYDTVWIGFKMQPEASTREVALASIWWTLLGFARDGLLTKIVQGIDGSARMVHCAYSPRRYGSDMIFGYRLKAGGGKAAAKALADAVAKLPDMEPSAEVIGLTQRKIVSAVMMQFQDKVGQAAKLGFAKFVKDQPDLYEGAVKAYKTVNGGELGTLAKKYLGHAEIVVFEGKP